MIILNFFLALILLGGVIIPSAISVSGEIDQSYAWSSGGNCSSQPKDVCGTLKLLNDSWLTTCHENYVAKIHDTVDEHSTNGLAIIQDILQGTGFLEYTFLFSGYYPAAIENGRYIVSLAYLLTVFVTYVVSFIFVIRSVAKFLRNISSATNDYGMVFAKIVFTGWDFNIKEANAAKIANSLFVSEVRAAFDEEDYNIRSQKLTKYQRIALYLRRVLINIIILSLIGVSWAGIYFLIKEAQQNENRTALLDFIWEYAPTLTVAALNIVFPIIFGILVRFERYKGSLELFLTLSRCVLVRLISLAILIISKVGLISQQSRVCEADNEFICWETYLGQQVYSVLILDALIQLGNTLIVNVARSQLKKIDNNICKSIGAIEFNVPGHVLDVVYVQAVCWIGVLYSPLIVTGSLLYFCILFALKLFTVTFICVPATRVFRTSKSSAMFMTILAFAFFMCLVPNGLALFYLCPSLACSPFRGLGYAWQSVTYYICSLSDGAYWIRSVLFTVDETVVLIALLLVVFILAVYYIALFGARGQMIQDLEKRLKTASKDKNLLLQEYNRAQKLYAQG
ncbi:hypothetical protein SK128_008936 [Halocaridina rubra]|uniref:TMC domain-containing protein n=1 Tax=Halocaridina rubra TaxID=373956 RepID=A0AAN9AC53_HALRR